jgi:hypothetical protein
MKNTSLLLFLIIIKTLVSGQNFVPIPADSTSEWRIITQEFDGMCVNCHDSRYFINGEIIINDKVFYKLYRSGVFYQEIGEPPGPCDEQYTFQNDYLGGLRTESGRVYFYNGYEEVLLYDFTLGVGDTLYSHISPGLIISEIDSVLVGEEYRKRYNFFNGEWYCNWMVEGIGHERGLIEPMFMPLEYYSEFFCYAENHIPIFPEGIQCVINVGINDSERNQDIIQLFPNPSTGKIYMTIYCDYQKLLTYSLSSVTGQVIFKKNCYLGIGKNTIKLDTDNLDPGFYFMAIYSQDGSKDYIKLLKTK